MSRIGSEIVEIQGASIRIGRIIWFSGPLGSQSLVIHPLVLIEKMRFGLIIKCQKNNRKCNMMQGTIRSLVHSMIRGVNIGFRRTLVAIGVGYRVQLEGQMLILNLGYSHPILFKPNSGVFIRTKDSTEFEIIGINKQLVGLVASELKRFRPLEPYKGKGLRFSDEAVVIKERKKTK